jgi:hypothetical protein
MELDLPTPVSHLPSQGMCSYTMYHYQPHKNMFARIKIATSYIAIIYNLEITIFSAAELPSSFVQVIIHGQKSLATLPPPILHKCISLA